MSSKQAYYPLLESPTPDEDRLAVTNGYFGSRQHPHNQNIQIPFDGEQSVDNVQAGRPDSPSASISTSPPMSDREWPSGRSSMDSEQHPLLRGASPPPNYERIDPIYTLWRNTVENRNNSGPNLSFGAPSVSVPSVHELPKLHIENEPQQQDRSFNVYSKCNQRAGSCQILRKRCVVLFKAVLIAAVFSLLGLAAAGLILGKRGFGWLPQCLTKDFVSRSYQIQRLESFDFSNTNAQNSGLPKSFSGVMHILSGPSDQIVDLNVSIRSIASDLRDGKTGADWRPASLISCAEVSLFFRPGLEVSTFRIASKSLNVILSSDLIVTDTTTISLQKGRIESKKFASSRETYIDVRNVAVGGAIGLHDVLSIKTRSGSVSVDVIPKSADGSGPKPAVLEVESRSGSVNLNYPGNTAEIPMRDYRSTITSRSGSVRGRIIHGKETTIDLRSGSLDVQIVPCLANGESSSLTTKLQSGSSHIELLAPCHRQKHSLARISSLHTGRSGQLHLKYPDEWQGSIYGEARSGSLDLRGHDIHIIDERVRGARKSVRAEKGRGNNQLKFEVRSGGVDVVIGQ